ncbi:type II toxin-antitoxin system Phd/YefM family antitoxin [Microbacterium sp. A82]|uniref:type II toxin-antitoxin system Phd/YefM family antitoxin n=1 Tax=unclassified Microbacterium TaxID=2609290 RepID=UPI003F2F7E45
MAQHNVLDARNNLSRLIAESQSGEDVVITKRGAPVARLVPIGPVDLIRSGTALIEWIESNPVPTRLSRTSAELDAQIAAARDSWE